MSEDDDDLYGRQLVGLLAFFVSFSGLLLLIAWSARPNWLWDSPPAAFAAAGAACYPARFLVERFDWWKRLEEPTQWTRARRERARRRVPTGAPAVGRHGRARSWRTVLRMTVAALLTLAVLALIPVGISAGRQDEELARTGPVQQAEVVSVEEDKWSGDGELVLKVSHPGHGAAVEVSGAAELEPLPAVGDQLAVIVDPDDPSNVLAAEVDWTMPWYGYLLIIVIGLVLAWFPLMFALA